MSPFGSDGHLRVGAWLGRWPLRKDLDAFEQDIGFRLDLVHLYADGDSKPEAILDAFQPLRSVEAAPLVTWEPRFEGHEASTVEIARGDHDDAVRALGSSLGRDPGRTLLRPMHEMNGDWYGWALGGHPENKEASYREAWGRIRDLVRDAGAEHVEFVWAPNHESVGEGATMLGSYPGDAQVDVVGVDGFNWLPERPRSFEALFDRALAKLTAGTGRPIIITEMACAESHRDGQAKAAWIHDALRIIVRRKYVRLTGFVWFHEDKREAGRPRRWRIDSSTQSLDAFKAGLLWVHSPASTAPTR